MKRFFEIGGVVAGVVLIAFGVAAIVLGVNGKNTVANELKLQQIVGTPDMSPKAITAEVKAAGLKRIGAIADSDVHRRQPADQHGGRARCFARVHADPHARGDGGSAYAPDGHLHGGCRTRRSRSLMPGGGTDNTQYAALDPTTQQPVQNGPRNIWVTETALTTALNSSYMAEQMANFGIVVGIALAALRLRLHDPRPRRRATTQFDGSSGAPRVEAAGPGPRRRPRRLALHPAGARDSRAAARDSALRYRKAATCQLRAAVRCPPSLLEEREPMPELASTDTSVVGSDLRRSRTSPSAARRQWVR